MVDPAYIGQFLLALAVLFTTLSARWSTQTRAFRREAQRLRREVDLLRQDNESLESHIYHLRRLLAHHGIERPELPQALYDDPPEGAE